MKQPNRCPRVAYAGVKEFPAPFWMQLHRGNRDLA
jgi:hypothetical protein